MRSRIPVASIKHSGGRGKALRRHTHRSGYAILKAALEQAWALSLLAVALLFTASTVAEAGGNFATVTLPKGVSIDVPRNWVVLSDNQRITLDTSVDSVLDLSGIEYDTSELPFAANYYDDRGNTIAILNVRYYPELDLSQADARSATIQDVQELDAAIKENLLKGMEAFGMSIPSWSGTTKSDINGIVTFITEYRRASLQSYSSPRVKLIRVFAEDPLCNSHGILLELGRNDATANHRSNHCFSKAYRHRPSHKRKIGGLFCHVGPIRRALAHGVACLSSCHGGSRLGPTPPNTLRFCASPNW